MRHDEEQLAQGYPPVTRMCSCCGGTFHDGTVIRVDELLTVSDDKRFRCTRCEGLRAELRIPWEEIQRIRDRERAREAGEDYPPQRPWDDGRDPREAGSHRWVANTDAARRYHGGAPDDV